MGLRQIDKCNDYWRNVGLEALLTLRVAIPAAVLVFILLRM